MWFYTYAFLEDDMNVQRLAWCFPYFIVGFLQFFFFFFFFFFLVCVCALLQFRNLSIFLSNSVLIPFNLTPDTIDTS